MYLGTHMAPGYLATILGSLSHRGPTSTPASQAASGKSAAVKRKYLGKENASLNTDPKKRRKKQALTNSDKVKLFHGFIKTKLQWSYSEAIFYTSQATSNFDFDSTSTVRQVYQAGFWIKIEWKAQRRPHVRLSSVSRL